METGRRLALWALAGVLAASGCSGAADSPGGGTYDSPGALHQAIVAAGLTCDGYADDPVNPATDGSCSGPNGETLTLYVAPPDRVSDLSLWRENYKEIMQDLASNCPFEPLRCPDYLAILLGDNWLVWPVGGENEALLHGFQAALGGQVFIFRP